VSLKKLETILNQITSTFKIIYLDFNYSEFIPYWKRKIGGVVRFDERTIYIHSGLSPREEELTWLHEALSIYYYQRGILPHDEEVEEETRKIYQQPGVRSLLVKYIKNYR
jgi:hypothetical protein